MHVKFTYRTYSRRYQFVVIIIVTHFRHAFSFIPTHDHSIVSRQSHRLRAFNFYCIFCIFEWMPMLGARA